MKVLGILGSQSRDGLTAQLLTTVLQGSSDAGHETEQLFLYDYTIKPLFMEQGNDASEVLEKMNQSDLIIFATPTYFRTVSGVMKNLIDCLHSEIVTLNKHGEFIPSNDQINGKQYISLTTCFTSRVENILTNATGNTFWGLDLPLQAAGMIRWAEIVHTGTFKSDEIAAKKLAECYDIGKSITTKSEGDERVRRYLQLLGMVCVATLITMTLQSALIHFLPFFKTFWGNYVSFTAIFFLLLAVVLRYATIKKHKRM